MGPFIIRMLIALIIGMFPLWFSPYPLEAQEDKVAPSTSGELDDILRGFDDEPVPGKKEENLDEVLEGFEEKPGEADGAGTPDDVLKGFEEGGKDETPTERAEEQGPGMFSLSGTMSLGLSYAYAHEDPPPGRPDYEGITRLRPDLHLELEGRLPKGWKALISGRAFFDFAYRLNDRELFEKEVLETYEREAEFQEIYLQGALLNNLDLKIGRQIVVWGKSDNIRVTDVLNPLDNREPGLIDIEDLRLPVTMTKVDFYAGPWNLSAIALHEIRFNKTPVFGSEYFPGTTRPPPDKEPATTLDNTEFAFALNGIFSGWDVSFYYARFRDDEAHVERVSPMILERRHSRLNMWGTAVNVALGNWLLKSEAAVFEGLEFFSLPEEDKSRWDVLAGVEYSGFRNTTLTLEAANRHIMHFDPVLEAPPDSTRKDEFQTAFRYTGDYLHDKLHLVGLLSFFGLDGEEGAFQRVSAGYDLTDAVNLTFGIVTYQSGERPELSRIGDKDRIFLEIKYSF